MFHKLTEPPVTFYQDVESIRHVGYALNLHPDDDANACKREALNPVLGVGGGARFLRACHNPFNPILGFYEREHSRYESK